MLKALLKFRNADSTSDLNTQLAGFIAKGIISGGAVVPVVPNSVPQVTVSPFKLIGADGMVVIETSDTQTFTLPANQTTIICFQSQYNPSSDPLLSWQQYEISAYNALGSSAQSLLTIFAAVTSGSATDAPVVDYSLRNALDPLARLFIRGVVSSNTDLPSTGNLVGDAYLVESGVPDENNGLYVYKGSTQGWINITDSLSIESELAQHRSNLFANEIHLTNAQADAALGSSGSPSALNPYVTSVDPRLPTQAENDALTGLSQTTPTAPSITNPFVTGAYTLAEPTDLVLTAVGAYLILTSSTGPYFVGQGVGNASALPYFDLFHPTLNREYVNSSGAAVNITGIYKDNTGPTPLDPSSEPTVAASNGFYAGNIYLTYSGVIDSSVRVRFGKQLNLSNISRGLAVKNVAPSATGEVLARMQAISGRLIDDPVQTGESNVALRQGQLSQRRYLNTTTTADMVIPNSDFAHLRQISDIAADFAANYGDIQMFGATPVAYTTLWSNTDVASFDPSHTEDEPNVAVIRYVAGTVLPAIQPGWTWVDDLGTRYRILSYDGNLSIMIYTAGESVNVNNANGNQSQILKSNNPRQLEILEDFRPSFYQEFFPVDDIAPIIGQFESLPPGGLTVGSYVPVGSYSMIGTSVLPNQGNSQGTGRGRPLYYVKPYQNGNRPDTRLLLIGSWLSDQVNYPRQAVGLVSQHALGIEYTGRLTSMTLWTKIRPTMPYGFRVFVDGVYVAAASKLLTSIQDSSLNPSAAFSTLRGNLEKSMMPLTFDQLGLSDNLVHTVRIEVTVAGADPFPLYAVSTYYAGCLEAQGRGFVETDYVNLSTDNTVATPVLPAVRSASITRYIDRVSQTRQTGIATMPTVFSLVTNATATQTVIADATIAQSAVIGDVYLFTTRSTVQADATNYVYRRVVAVDKNAGTYTIDSALGFVMASGSSRVEFVFRVPTAPNGIPVVSAATSKTSTEYARLGVSDWSVGLSRDIANLGTVSPDNRVTVLDDGQTSLLVNQCRQVTTGMLGFSQGISLSTTTSSMTINSWGTRSDVVFSGAGGVSSTVQIEIDGLYTYQITLPNDGLYHHACFHSGAAQSHTVKIFNPSVAGAVVVSQWIFSSISPASISGTSLYSYETPRNAVAGVTSYYDFAPTTSTDPLTVSNSGLRIFDITKYGAKIYDGSTGTTLWSVNQDLVNNPRFGYVTTTDYASAFMDIHIIGQHAELIYLAGPAQGISQIYIDGIVASNGNFPGLMFGQGYASATGQVDMYAASSTVRRFVLTGLSQGVHKIRIQNTTSKNAASTGNFLTMIAAAENSGAAVVNHQNSDDTLPNRLHMQAWKDLRQFLSVTADQIGIVATSGGTSTGNGLTLGYINSSFVMSDGSGTAQNCTLGGGSGSITYVNLAFPWTPAVNPGLTVGDLEVRVNGQVIPRYVAGVTVDAYYVEDLTNSGRINFWADLSTQPISIEVGRKSGTVDTSSINSARIQAIAGVIVGTAAQVSYGIADYSTLTAALAAAPTGGKITLLPNFVSTENIVLTKQVSIEGHGYSSHVTGTITFSAGLQFTTIRNIYASQFIMQSGATQNQVMGCYWDTAPTDPNTAGLNTITGLIT